MKKILNSCLAIVFALSMASITTSCQPAKANKSVYRSAFEGDVPSLDPIQVGDTQSHDVAHHIFNGLVRYRPEVKNEGEKLTDLIPDLAESWEVSEDGKTYTFKLRKDVKFHNGRPLKAQDFKYSFERLANPKNASKGLWTLHALPIAGVKEYKKSCEDGACDDLSGVQVIDEHTLQLKLKQMVPFALHVLAMSYYYVHPKEEVEKWDNPKQFSTHAVGTGPYKLKEWVRKQKLILVRNDDYFEEGVPKIDELRYYIVPDENVRFLWFENGELEHLNPLPPASFGRILSDPHLNKMGARAIRDIESINDQSKSNLIKSPLLVIQYLGFDNMSEPFTDKKIRQAFNYGVDKRKIIDVVLNGRGIPAKGVLPYGFPAFDPSRNVPYPYNPEKARQLLAEAGWSDSDGDGYVDKDGKNMHITFWHNQNVIYAKLGTAVQADLKEIGIKIDIRAMEWAPYIKKIRQNEAIFFRMGWQADYPDPDNYLWTLLSTVNVGQDNAARYSNPEYDKLVNEARAMTDWSAREKLYREAESMVIEDAPWLFLYSTVEYKLVQPYVKNQQLHPLIQNEMPIVTLNK